MFALLIQSVCELRHRRTYRSRPRNMLSLPVFLMAAVIHELEKMREMLRNEGERVSREIASYASLSQLSVSSMKAVSDSLAASKGRSA
jgi:hypothetical protein